MRPIIFCINGYEHWLWDDQSYPLRAVAGLPSELAIKDEEVPGRRHPG